MQSESKRLNLVVKVLGAALLAVTVSATAQQDYPNRPIKLVVPFGPGSVSDSLGRILGQNLNKSLGQPVVVDNQSGAGGNIGTAYVAAADPDGYTLLLGATSTNAVNPSLFNNLKYDAINDFTPVTNLASVANVLVVHPDVPAKSVKELLDILPGRQFSYASTGTGGSMHLSGELFKMMTKADIQHVPYRGGGAALADLLPGRVQMMFCNLPLCLPHIQAGKLRALAVTSGQRSSLLPDVPTLSEAGLPGYEVNGWFGLFVPKGVDPAIVATLNQRAREALEQPEVKKMLQAQGAVPSGGPSDEFKSFVKAEHDKWAKVIKEANIKVE